jgi:hypothetical protein
VGCRSHRNKTWKEREFTGGKKKGKGRNSKAKNVGDTERGKVAAKNWDSGGNWPFHQRLSVAS